VSSDAALVTGEAVALDLRPAALPSRIVAGFVDAGLQLVVLLVIGGLATAVSLELSTAAQQAAGVVLLVLVLIVYPVTFETLLRGRTPGKAAMGLRVVRDDGGPIGFRHALARGLLGAAVERPGSPCSPPPCWSPRSTSATSGSGTCSPARWWSASGSRCAAARWPRCRPAGRLGGRPGPDRAERPARPVGPPVRVPGRRADADRPGGPRRAAGRGRHRRVGPAPSGTPGWAVLSAVLAERRRREQQRLAPRESAPVHAEGAEPQAQVRVAPPAAPPPPPAGGFAPPG
jgi:hypothetical protein